MLTRCFLFMSALLVGLGLGCAPQTTPPPASSQPVVVSERTAPPQSSRPVVAAEAAKPVEVTADTFANSAAALQQLVEACKQTPQNHVLTQQCEKWLKLQGNESAEALAKLSQDATQPLEVRMTTCRMLAAYGNAAVPGLCAIAKANEPPLLRIRALDGLVKIKPYPPETIQLYLELLNTTDVLILNQTLLNLAKIGEPAAAAAEKLQQLRQQHDREEIRTAAGDALKKVAPRRTF